MSWLIGWCQNEKLLCYCLNQSGQKNYTENMTGLKLQPWENAKSKAKKHPMTIKKMFFKKKSENLWQLNCSSNLFLFAVGSTLSISSHACGHRRSGRLINLHVIGVNLIIKSMMFMRLWAISLIAIIIMYKQWKNIYLQFSDIWT